MLLKITPYHAFLLILFIFACKNEQKKPTIALTTTTTSTFHQAGEFELTAAVWLYWSNYDNKQGYSSNAVQLEMIRQIAPYSVVKVAVANDSLATYVTSKLSYELIQTNQVKIIVLPHQEVWARDIGPNFVVNAQGEKAIVDYDYNYWGYQKAGDPSLKTDETADENVAKSMQLPCFSTNLVTEGGNHEVNGKGVLIASEVVALGRNPTMTLAQIEAEYKRLIGVKKIIWLKKGVREDDQTFRGVLKNEKGETVYTVIPTGGHVDEVARFVDANTILLSSIDSSDLKDPIALETATRMEENYQILKAATDQDGKPFRILRMAVPKTYQTTMQPGDGVYDYIKDLTYLDKSVFPKGKPIKVIAATSYINFLIVNELILTTKYARSSKDKELVRRDENARKVLQVAFPNKKIVQIDAMPINLGGGGLHCITMNEPK
ncbi:MAG: hypothetical protein RLZZ292_3631 [Bacteroidota bacterium]|jgi:agmatine deiminase